MIQKIALGELDASYQSVLCSSFESFIDLKQLLDIIFYKYHFMFICLICILFLIYF
jgi:hypothetical protein